MQSRARLTRFRRGELYDELVGARPWSRSCSFRTTLGSSTPRGTADRYGRGPFTRSGGKDVRVVRLEAVIGVGA